MNYIDAHPNLKVLRSCILFGLEYSARRAADRAQRDIYWRSDAERKLICFKASEMLYPRVS